MIGASQMRWGLLIFAAILLSGKVVFASSEMMFYELDPNRYYTTPYNISSAPGPVYLLFQPQNDFLSSFDFWFDNDGDAGTVTFILRNAAGSVLASRTKIIDHIPVTLGGQAVHISLISPIAVSNTGVYSIEIGSSLPKLQIYYVNRVEIVGHSGQSTSPYLIGVTKIGDVEQIFTFKYALYETNDNTPPVIYATSTSNVSAAETKLFWRANEPIDYRIEYGAKNSSIVTHSTNYNGTLIFCGDGWELCSVSMAVIPGTDYFYNLFTKDSWGNEGVSYGTFTSVINPAGSPAPGTSLSPNSNGNTSQAQSPLSEAAPQTSPQTNLPPAEKYKNNPDDTAVNWSQYKGAESYVVRISGQNTGHTEQKTATKNQTQASFSGIPADNYKIEVYAVDQNKGEKKIFEETTPVAPPSQLNFYLTIGGVVIFILVAGSVVYNKYKEYI